MGAKDAILFSNYVKKVFFLLVSLLLLLNCHPFKNLGFARFLHRTLIMLFHPSGFAQYAVGRWMTVKTNGLTNIFL